MGKEKELKFFLEGSLKGLGRWLRFLGFGAKICDKKITWEEIYAHKDYFFLVTSLETATMLEKMGLDYLVLPKSSVEVQLRILINKLNITPELDLNICSICGSKLITVDKEEIKEKVPERVYKFYNDFTYCEKCGKVYWEGDHIKRLRARIEKIVNI